MFPGLARTLNKALKGTDMKEHTLSAEAVKVFRKYDPYQPASRVPLLVAKRFFMTDVEDIKRCDRTLRALRSGHYF